MCSEVGSVQDQEISTISDLPLIYSMTLDIL